MLDIRKPIGFLFLIVSGILIVYSLVSPQITNLELVGSPVTLHLNLNLPCGAAMFIFACLMLGFSYFEKRER